MLSLDLFNTVYERALKEGAVDDLEARRIHGLNTKMLELMSRAKDASPEMKSALKREYEKIKAERDSYYKIRTEMGYGGLTHEGKDGIGQDLVSPQQRVQQSTPQKQTPVGKVVDTAKQAAKWLAGKGGPGKEGPTYEGAEDIADRGEYDQEGDMAKDNIHTIVRNAKELESILGNDDNLPEWVQDKLANIKGMMTSVSDYMQTQHEREHEEATGEEGITISEQEEEMYKDLGSGYGLYQLLLKAWNDKQPYVQIPMQGGDLTITRNQIFNVLYALKNMNDNSFKKTLQTAFTTLPKFMVWSNSIKRYQLPQEKPQNKMPGQLELFKEAGQKKKSKGIAEPQSAEVQRYLTKVRRAAPNATSDVEALAKNEIQTQRQNDRKLNKLDQEHNQLSKEIANLVATNQDQDSNIADLTKQVQTAPVAKPSTATPTTPVTTPAPGQPASTANVPKAQEKPQPVAQPTGVSNKIFIPEPELLAQKDQEIYSRVQDLEIELKDKIDAMASWNKVAANDDESRDELEMLRKDMERTKRELTRKIKQLEKSGAIPAQPQQRLDLAPLRQRPSPAASLRRSLGQTIGNLPARELPTLDEPELNILSQADLDRMGANLARQPVEVEESQMGKLDAMRQDLELMTDQQFKSAYKMTKKEFELRYRTLLKPTQQQDVPVIDEHGGGIGPKKRWQDYMEEGWQDFNKVEPYEVCLAGRPVKQFDYYEDARRFHDNWKKKLYREGNKEKADKITLNPILKENSTMTQQEWMKQIKQQYPTATFAQNKKSMQILAMVPGKGKVATYNPQQVNEFEVADLVRPNQQAQTSTPPRRAYSIALQGKPGRDFMAEYAWDALQSVFPKEYPVDSEAAEQKVIEVHKRGSAIVKTGIASEDIADSYVAKLAAKRVPAQFWKIIGGELEEAQQWQGNLGAQQAQTTDHTMDEAIAYVKTNYPAFKKFRITRAEPGFRADLDPDQYNRSNAQVNDVDSAMDYLQLRENPVMSGSRQISASLGYSWHTNENPGTGIAVFYYEDRGMGWDEVIIAGKTKEKLAQAVQVFRDAGIIPSPKAKVAEGETIKYGDTVQHPQFGQGRVSKVWPDGMISVDFPNYPDPIDKKPGVQVNMRPGEANYQKLTKGMKEAANPAQQAAIAIAMKKAGRKPKHVDEAQDQIDPIIIRALERLQPGLEGSQLYSAAKQALALEFGLMKARGDATFIHYLNQLQNIYSQRHRVKEDIGSWIVYDPVTKQIKKRFKTHTAGKSYAQTHGLGFASSEYYFDNIKPAVTAEGMTDYQKRRQRERDVDAGKPVARQRQPRQTDYQKRRAQDKKDMELGEATDMLGGDNFARELLGLIMMIGVPFAIGTFYSVKNKLNKYQGQQIIQALERKGVTMNQETYAKVKPILDKFDQAVTNNDGEQAKVLANRIEQMMIIGKLSATTPQPPSVQGKEAKTANKESVKEDQDTSAVESAIIRRIMVAHLDWLKRFGPEKVMQAAEEVAYNVGDVDEIGTSDVSAYVHEVGQILGVDQLDEKWSAKYKRSINCNNPKGFSQKAHCAGRKK